MRQGMPGRQSASARPRAALRWLLVASAVAATSTGLISWALGTLPRTPAFVLGKGAIEKKTVRLLPCVVQRKIWNADNPRPPPARPPRERKQTDLEKQADAIVHAVVAVELLHWHGKLGGTLDRAFRKCVYKPVLPRLLRLTDRKASADDFRVDEKTGKFGMRPSRVHDQVLEKQFTLGYAFTDVALEHMGRREDATWIPMAKLVGRRELHQLEAWPEDDPQAKELVAWSSGWAGPSAEDMRVIFRDRAVGHNDAKPVIYILPVFVDHDRTAHAERQALLCLLEACPMDPKTEGQDTWVGQIRVFATHTPCISCLSSMCQFTRAFPGGGIKVSFDAWKQTRRWLSEDACDERPIAEPIDIEE